MKFRKPVRDLRVDNDYDFVRACVDLVERLPAEFEIVPEGQVCVKWPEGLTKERLEHDAAYLVTRYSGDTLSIISSRISALAAIAPERKKRRVNLWRRFSGEQCWNECESMQPGWRKVAGPIEIDD